MTHRSVPSFPDAGKFHPYDHRRVEGDVVVDLIRPRDLLAVTVTLRGVSLEPPGENPPPGTPAHSTVVAEDGALFYLDFPFQHALEEASYETAKGPPRPASWPARYRPARGTRLVFRLAGGQRIPFTTAGLLAAVPWLEAVLHPVAAPPGTRPPPYAFPQAGPPIFLPPFDLPVGKGLLARATESGILISRLSDGDLPPGSGSLIAEARYAANQRIVASLAGNRGIELGEGISPGDAVERVGGRLRDLLAGRLDRGGVRGPGGPLGPRLPPVRAAGSFSRKATGEETAVEAPFRLQVSPTSDGHWVHAHDPVGADDAPTHVELWHSRLDTGPRTPETLLHPAEPADDDTRVIRAVWARDRDDLTPAEWRSPTVDQGTGKLAPDVSAGPRELFLSPLDRADRHRLVRQSAETWIGKDRQPVRPVPVGAEKLWLTSLGAWLEYHGQWATGPYSGAVPSLEPILAWDQVSTGGRDQFVQVLYPGYVFPLGQPAVRVKVTRRAIRPEANPRAGLFQREFLVLVDPVHVHRGYWLPFLQTTLRPLVTPALDPPGESPVPGLTADRAFWPRVGGKPFAYRVDALDREGRKIEFEAPLIWVAEQMQAPQQFAALEAAYGKDPRRVIDLRGQIVAFAPVDKDDATEDARVETSVLRLTGKAGQGRSNPRMSTADIVLPAVRAVAGTGTTTIAYFPEYRDQGFHAANRGRVWAATHVPGIAAEPGYAGFLRPGDPADAADPTVPLPRIGFGGGKGEVGSDRAGGFLQPNLTVAGLSMVQGPVGDLASVAAGSFEPGAMLAAALPKLFGLVPLTAILESGALNRAPALVTQALDSVTAILNGIEQGRNLARQAADEAQREWQHLAGHPGPAGEAQVLASDAETLVTSFEALAVDVGALINTATASPGGADQAAAAVAARLESAATAALAVARPPLPLFARTRLQQLAAELQGLARVSGLAGDLLGFLGGLDLPKASVTFKYEWTPHVRSWPETGPPLLRLDPDSLLLAIRGTIKAQGPPSVEVLAELRRFELILFASEPLMRIPIERLTFRSGSSGKAEVDVVMEDIVFGGFLEFVDTIKDLIPLDGFSDPPFTDVTAAGLAAGFTQALPNLAVGVFSLSNLALGADVQMPFLGEVLTIGFNFCSRERPFVLAVVFLGGGGWFLIRLSPRGLEILELGLEAGAYLSVNFGVASGSISAAIGVYIRLEGSKGSLTGYFRLRGEVDVLGLVSASIELYLELTYQFTTGKMVGRARITVEIEVLGLSKSVSIEAERQFAGSNNDPSLREVLMEPDGTAPAWDEYLLAFAPEEVQS